MGQIYSFLGYASTTENNLQTLLTDNFSCKICLEILDDPVQCQNNEHYFCRKCITMHLGNSEKCPLCNDQLTLETLRASPRIVGNVVLELMKSRCSSVATGGNKAFPSIYIFGGRTVDDKPVKSVEIYDWSAKKWALIEECLFFYHYNSFSFLYGKKMMICGGEYTNRIEYLNPSERGNFASVHPVALPSKANYVGVLHENQIFSFYFGVIQTSLQSTGESNILKGTRQCVHADRNSSTREHCFGDSIYIVGGEKCEKYDVEKNELQIARKSRKLQKEHSNGDSDRVPSARGHCIKDSIYIVGDGKCEKYDVKNNELQTVSSLPYHVQSMATVVYKDNIIILGGDNGTDPLKDVMMFNVTSHEYIKLPSMLEKRSGCTAAILRDQVIVVMGGRSKDTEGNWTILKSAECYKIGGSKWGEFPAMNIPRYGATAFEYD